MISKPNGRLLRMTRRGRKRNRKIGKIVRDLRYKILGGEMLTRKTTTIAKRMKSISNAL